MKLSTNHLIQCLLTVAQIIAQVGISLIGTVPERYRFIAAGVIGACQWIVSHKAHFSNTDGTPQTEAFGKDE